MKRISIFLILVSLALPVFADSENISFGGSIDFKAEFLAGKDFDFSDGYFSSDKTELDLHLDIYPIDGLRLYAEALAGAENLIPKDTTLEALAGSSTAYSFDLKEAYAAYTGFLFDSLDLKAGRQRITWGVGEQVSVLDILDSPDLSLPIDMGSHVTSDAVRLDLYSRNSSLQLVFIPIFRPAVLPADPTLFAGSMPASVTPELAVPEHSIPDQWSAGARGNLFLASWDFSAYYAYTRERLPVLTELNLDGTNPVTPIPESLKLTYPRKHVVGADFTGELFGLGVWGEIAGYIPDYETIFTTNNVPVVGTIITKEKAAAYLKWLVGLDYTFPGGLYANIQYVHGLFHENVKDSLSDYVLIGFEWPIGDGKCKIGPVGAGFEFNNAADVFSGDREFKDSWGVTVTPELHFYPKDGFDIYAGARWFTGADGSTFKNFASQNGVYAGLKVSF